MAKNRKVPSRRDIRGAGTVQEMMLRVANQERVKEEQTQALPRKAALTMADLIVVSGRLKRKT